MCLLWLWLTSQLLVNAFLALSNVGAKFIIKTSMCNGYDTTVANYFY